MCVPLNPDPNKNGEEMRYQMYTIHDQAVKKFLPADYLQEDAEAVRKFTHNVNNKEMGFLNTAPEHFTLYRCGEFDTDNGRFESYEPVVIIKAIQVKNTENN